jgi:hypothetical protein
MRVHPRIPRPRSIAAVVMSLGLGGVATIALVTDASAHANSVSGSSVCTNGTYSITWTVHNDWNLVENVTLGTSTGGGTVSGLPESVPASGDDSGGPAQGQFATNTFTQTGILGSATSASVTVNGTWSDTNTHTDSALVVLAGNCKTSGGGGGGGGGPSSSSPGTTVAGSVTQTAPAGGGGLVTVGTSAPLLVQGVCTTGTMAPPAISIPGITGVSYLNGATVLAPGDHPIPFGASYAVTAVVQAGFTLVGGSVTSWTFTTAASASCSVSPSVLGVTFVGGPPAAPVKAPPVAVLPFTGMPLLPTVALGFGLLLAGALLIGSGRRHRVTRGAAATAKIGPRRF